MNGINQMTTLQLYLAPLRGFTDYIYRNTITRHFDGFDGALAPFIPTVTADRFKSSHFEDILPENNPTLTVVPQIIGNHSGDFINLAVRLFDLGYTSVNWNLGCPFPMVTKKNRGSGLLPYPERIDTFLEKTLSSIPNRLSIKTRLGRRTITDIFELLPIFNRYPLEEIIPEKFTIVCPGCQKCLGKPSVVSFFWEINRTKPFAGPNCPFGGMILLYLGRLLFPGLWTKSEQNEGYLSK